MRKGAAEGESRRKAKGSSKQDRPKRPRKAKAVLERTPVVGWKTCDEDEIALRRWRGRTEILDVVSLNPDQAFFGAFRARSASGGAYEVEIRSLDRPINSCGCIDHRVNGLGTCKHIEGVLAALQRGKTRAFRAAAKSGSPKIEVFFDRGAGAATIVFPKSADEPALAVARAWLNPWLDDEGRLSQAPEKLEGLLAAWPTAPAEVKAALAVSRHFGSWLDRVRRENNRRAARAAFEADLALGHDTIDVLAHPLLPYQRLGAMHLAFGERVLLADDMGLGKTIQAIAACELLARRKGIARVLVVCPASLKAEWEEQIARFSQRPTRLVFGPRDERLAAYRAPVFFTVVNYEQVLSDADDINALLKPDIVVLDEAQRIKNWQTKTARRVKSLKRAVRLRADRHARRKPHRRALFDRPVSRSRDFRAAVSLQSRFLRTRRARPARRLQKSRRTARPGRSGHAEAAQGRGREGAAGTHGQNLTSCR